MVRTLLLVILTIWSMHMSAQPYRFGLEGSQWVYNFFTQGRDGYHYFQRGQDTIINQKAAFTLNLSTKAWLHYPGRPYIEENSQIWLSFDDDVLYFYDTISSLFDTVINYRAAPGDHWEYQHDRWMFRPEGYVLYEVQDTGTSLFGAHNLRWLTVNVSCSCDNNYYPSYTDTLIDVIGGRGFIIPYDYFYQFLDGGIGGPLVCYKDDELGVVDQNYGYCDQLLSVQKVNIIPVLPLYPNPAIDFIKVKSHEGLEFMEIYDLNGRRLKVLPYTERIQIHDLNDGWHFLVFKNFRQEVVARAKFLKYGSHK